MYNVAVIGCGMIAGFYEELESPSVYSHAKAYYLNEDISEIAFVSLHPEHSRFMAKKYTGVDYHNLKTVLKSFQPVCISVCVPDDHHYPVLTEIIELSDSVKVIFVEKPVCTNKEELEILRELEDSSGIKIIVHHNRRFDPSHKCLKKFIQTGSLGRLIRGDIDYYGGWCHNGVHIVDGLQFLFNSILSPTSLKYACESKYSIDPTLHVDAEIVGAPIKMTGHDESFYQILDMNLKFDMGQIKIENFGQDIRVFKKIVNQERENILEPDVEQSRTGMLNPIVCAVKTIVEYLNTYDESILYPFGLEQAEKTMDTIWKGKGIYENKS